MNLRHLTRWVLAGALGAATLAVVPSAAEAKPDGSAVVINEVYINGGSAGATYTNKFVELYNPTAADVVLTGTSLQYRPPTNTGAATNVFALTGTIPAGGHYLVQGASNGANGAAFPLTANQSTTAINPGNAGGTVFLTTGTTAINPGTPGAINGAVLDLVGYGTANVYEGTGAASGNTVTKSLSRNATHVDTDNNAGNFTPLDPPQPCSTAGCPTVEPPAEPVVKTIAEIQGPGAATPLAANTLVTTTGVVTGLYKTGGFNGGYIQTEGTSGPTGTTSNGLFVFGSSFANGSGVAIGKVVTVTGPVAEFNGQTQVTANSFSVVGDPATPLVPENVSFPMTETQKESREGMLVRPQGQFTITNNYSTNQYAEIGLAPGTKPFQNSTNAALPGAAANALAAQNAADLITLDDASSLNFFSAANQGTAVPWLTNNEVRVGQGVTFTAPVVLDYRNSLWKLQPTSQVLADSNGPIAFGPSTRAAAPASVGDGNVKIGTFNVLNYFTTTAEDWDALPGNVCTYYTDRAGVNVTANECGNPASSSGNGPRGAANAASLARQQAKIVKAIQTLDADVVSLEEIENSVQFGKARDAALKTLVAALNEDAGFDKWAAPAEPTSLPALAEQDLIRTAFIYQKAHVEPVDAGRVLVGSAAFSNAREPYGQAFKPTGADDASAFLVIVNHFKSKGSGTGLDDDQNDGQGFSNYSRVQQANALLAFADTFADDLGTERVFLTGDFNSYDKEDPIRAIEAAGFVNVADELTDKDTYAFSGAVGSLDHVFAADAVFDDVTGADVWNINSFESVGREYSRWNYNVSPLVDLTAPYRASDHDPELVAFSVPTAVSSTVQATAPTVKLGEEATVDVIVTSTGDATGGTVTVSTGDTQLGTGVVRDDGLVTVSLGDDLAVGTYPLTVAFAGTDGAAASDTTASLTVDKADSAIDASVPPTADYDQDVTVSATVTGTSPTGIVTVSEGGTTYGSGPVGSDGSATVTITDPIAPGQHTLTVTYGGDGNNASSSDTVTLTVGPVPATLDATAPSTIRVGQDATVTVVATGLAPTGTVTLSEGDRLVGSADLVDGRTQFQVSELSQGFHTLTATYSGDASNAGSTDSVEIRVIKARTDLTATVASTPYGTGARLQVTGTPGATGALFVFDEAGNGVGMGQLRDGAATLTLDRTIAVGAHELTVAFAGSAAFEADTVTTALTVTKATATVTRAAITSKIVVNKTRAVVDVRVGATGYTVANGVVGIYQGSTLLGSANVSNGRAVVTLKPFTAVGTRTIVAKYLGNAQTTGNQTSFKVTVVPR